MRRLQRLGKLLPLLSLLIILGIGALTFRLHAPAKEHLRRALVWELSRALNRKVELRESQISLFSGWHNGERVIRLSLRAPTLAEKTATEEPFLRAEKLTLDLTPASLVSGRGLIGALRQVKIFHPRLQLVRDHKGNWNFSDLLALKQQTAPTFQGKIEVVDGAVTILDYSPPLSLPLPQQNQLTGIGALVNFPAPRRCYFRFWGKDGKRLGSLYLSGRREVEENAAPSSRIVLSGGLRLSGTDLSYLWQYRSFSPKVDLAQGRGDLVAYFRAGTGARRPPVLDYSLALTGAQAQLSMPWIHQPARDLSGILRISNGVVQFEGLQGRLGGSRVQGGGYLLTSARALPAILSPPSSKPIASAPRKSDYALSFHSPTVSSGDLGMILPRESANDLAELKGQGALKINLFGKKGNGAVFGDFSSSEMSLRQTVPAGLPNKWQAVKTDFLYANHTLAAAAAGKMGLGETRAALVVSPQRQMNFFATLSGIALSAPTTTPQGGKLSGTLQGNLQGAWNLAARETPNLQGELALLNGNLVNNVSPGRSLPFTDLLASFSYDRKQVNIPRLLLESDYGTLAFAGTLNREINGRLEAQALDLTRLGENFNLPLQGLGFVSADLSGPLKHLSVQTQADIFSGRWQGYAFDWLRAQAQIKGRSVSDFSLVFQRGSGDAGLQGHMTLPEPGREGELAITGQIEKAQVSDWLPAAAGRYSLQGILDAKLSLEGTFSQPRLTADFSLLRPALAGMQFEQAEGKLSYDESTLALENFLARVNHTQLAASGKMQNKALDFAFSGEGLDLATLLASRGSFPRTEGKVSLRGTVKGTPDSPQLAAWLRVDDLAAADRRIGNLETDLTWDGKQISLEKLDLSSQAGRLTAAGTLTRPETAAPPSPAAWLSNLKLDIEGMPVGLIVDLVDIYSRDRGKKNPLAKALAFIPRPLGGYLSAAAALTGKLNAPSGKVDFALAEGSAAGQHLPALEGSFSFAGKDFTIASLTAKEVEALATAQGKISLGGATDLKVEVHNLNAAVLRPWMQVPGMGGSADVFFQVLGATADPKIRGDLEIADPVFDNLALERLKIDSFLLDGDSLKIDNLRIVKGPHLAGFSATLPWGWHRRQLQSNAPLQAEVRLEKQDLSFLTALWPQLGDFSGPLEARLEIGGAASRPRLESGFLQAQGTWADKTQKIPFSLQGKVRDQAFWLEGENYSPGFLATVESAEGNKTPPGKLSAQGNYDPFAGPATRWGRGKYRVALKADNFSFALANLLQGRANADLVLQGTPGANPADKITGTFSVPRAVVNVPQQGVGKTFTWRPAFSPQLDIQLEAKEIIAETSRAKVIFSGAGHIGGRLGYEPLTLEAKLKADKGALDFPAATAEVKAMEITLSKQAEQPLRALGTVNAVARAGRYRIELSGGGPLLPENDLRITAAASPALSNEQAIALLLGLPPNLAGTTAEEILGKQVTQNFSSSFTSLAATGLSAPLLRAIGLNELSFGFSPLASNVQIGKRLAEKIYIYYFSSTGGPTNSTLLRFIFDITPVISLGISVDDNQQWQYEVQTSRGF
jgi:hypothetical protein